MKHMSQIKKAKVNSNRAFIIFEMVVLNNRINFCCLVYFKNSKTETLMNKLENSFDKIEIIKQNVAIIFLK